MQEGSKEHEGSSAGMAESRAALQDELADLERNANKAVRWHQRNDAKASELDRLMADVRRQA